MFHLEVGEKHLDVAANQRTILQAMTRAVNKRNMGIYFTIYAEIFCMKAVWGYGTAKCCLFGLNNYFSLDIKGSGKPLVAKVYELLSSTLPFLLFTVCSTVDTYLKLNIFFPNPLALSSSRFPWIMITATPVVFYYYYYNNNMTNNIKTKTTNKFDHYFYYCTLPP